MSAGDWLLNVCLRCWLHSDPDAEIEGYMRVRPTWRRDNLDQMSDLRTLLSRFVAGPPRDVWDAMSTGSVRAGVEPLKVHALYVFEQLLRDDLRAAGRRLQTSGPIRAKDAPADFWGPLDGRGRQPLQSSGRSACRPAPMPRATVSPAVEVVADALLQRKAHPDMPPLEVLDQAMASRRGRRVAFGDLTVLPTPFALLAVEAFDTGMSRGDWEGLWRCNSHNGVRPFLLQLFADEIWPQFRVRYGQY